MTTHVQQLLSAFDALTLGEKQQAAVEVLRRITALAPAEIPDEAFDAIADELFCELDTRESADGNA